MRSGYFAVSNPQGGLLTMKEHVSFMKEPMDHFVAFMEASDRWCNNYDENLHLFDLFLSKNYPDATILTNDMVDGWCNKRSSENAQSRHTRIKAVIAFIKYLSNCSGTP